MSPGKLLGLRRLADDAGRFKMLAVDQRPPIEALVRAGRGSESASFEDVARLKMTLIEALSGAASALLFDPHYIFPAAIHSLPRDCGLLITLEDDTFDDTDEGRLSHTIPDWSVRKIRIAGGDAVKVLAWYRPDAGAEVLEHQQRFTAEIGAQCARYDIPYVFELLVYPFPHESGHRSDYVEHPLKKVEQVVESVQTFADPRFGIDIFKLESPLPAGVVTAPNSISESDMTDAFSELGRAAGRPWVMLSAGATPESFERILELAYQAGASGYLAGRAIWWEACASHFPDWEGTSNALKGDSLAYMERLNLLTDERAQPWFDHPSFGDGGPVPPEAGPEFRAGYAPEAG
jgi:tagatose 1,6-diphosphate aldolase